MPDSRKNSRISNSKSSDMPSFTSAKADMSSVLYNGRAISLKISQIAGMESTGWRERLALGIETKGKSFREVSLAAGKAHGYVHAMLKADKDPAVDNLIAVCEAADLSPTWVLFGVQMDRETEEIVRQLAAASPARRKGLLQFLRDEAAESASEPAALPPATKSQQSK